MPIFEFKCLECKEFFEILVLKKDEEKEIKCPKCDNHAVERVVSATNYTMGSSANAKKQGVSRQERQCSGGSCSTYTVPGETRG